jgi:hypothetical protein
VRFYTEGLCVLALVEAFVMGGEDKHYISAQDGIACIVRGQRPEGGWMYSAGDADWGDTSVTGMMFQPLKQGQMAFLDFDEEALKRGGGFVERLTDADGWVQYRRSEFRRKIAITAIGNLVRVYAGAGFDDPKVKQGLDLVLANRAEMKTNLYFLYYGVMLTFLAGGDAWKSWRDDMLPFLLEKQTADGAWKPEGSGVDTGYADYLSDVDATAMALLSLEACYRYVPANMLK